MDLGTENRLAALLMEEARRLRLQAEKEGVGVYIRQPKARGRPNARFLTATVLGVQQANRAVEVNEMWRAREKEVELDNKLSLESKYTGYGQMYRADLTKESSSSRHKKSTINDSAGSSRRNEHRYFHSEEADGLRDEEVDEFLHSRSKRGRGAIGSRMDEPGPYPVCSSADRDDQLTVSHEAKARDEWKRRPVIGPQPEKPSCLLNDERYKPSGRPTEENGASRSRKRHSKKPDGEESTKRRKKVMPRHKPKSR